MNDVSVTEQALLAENEELRSRLDNAEETLRAIRAGEVDALIVDSAAGPQVFILQSADAESNRFRSDILGKVSDAVIAIDESHHVIYLNAAAERQYGVAASEVLGSKLTDVYRYRWLNPEDRDNATTALNETGRWRGRNIHIKRNGEVVHVESTVSRLTGPDGSPSGLLSVIRDITTQSLTEEALRASEAAHRIAVQNLHLSLAASGAVTWEWYPGTETLEWSPQYRELYGFTSDEPGHHKAWSGRVHPDDLPGVLARVQEIVDTPGNDDLRVEFRINHPTRGIRWIGGRGLLLRDSDGNPFCMRGINFDITDRKTAEEALRENQAHLQLTLEAARIGNWDLDLATDRSKRSLLHDQIFGYQKPVTNWGFQKFIQHVHPEDRAGIERQFHAALTALKDWRFECRILWPDASIHWITGHGSIFDTPQNPSKRMLGIVYDITERKQVEEALRHNEALFFTLINQAPGGVYVVDDQFLTMQVNSLARPTFAAAEPVIGRDFAEVMCILWGPVVGKQLADIFRHTLATGERYISPRFTGQRHDLGEEKSYDWETQRITLPNGQSGVVCYFTDVTEQWLLEEALRASEQRAVDIIQSISDGFVTLDQNWRITYLSARGAEMLAPLQTDISSIIGRSHWDQFPDGLGGPIEENYRRAMSDKVPVQFEVFYTPLGTWFEIRAYPSSSGLSVYFLDISERKKSEKSLADQAAALRNADRSKDEFLAMLAHELRNPLAPLRNATEILQTPSASFPQREHAQQLLVRQIDNMSRMIDDLLDVSRITQGKIELRKERVEIGMILSAAAHVAGLSCPANAQELTVSLPDKPVFMEADATRLEQVFGNLLGNASKYSGIGSHISMNAELVSDREIIVRISDDGIGIDPELLPRVFDLFVQSSRTLDRSHGGLGIGLTIVHRLVKLHGGTIEARSEGLGQGTEFIVRLPVLDASAIVPATHSPVSLKGRSFRMLIVDDNQDAAETMAMVQELHGHETRIAHTGAKALAEAAIFLPEVVLLDIGLPGMDGFDVARHLRTMPGLSEAFLVALTGYGTDSDRQRAKAAGFDEHLVKPADLALLRQWLRSRD